MLSQTKCDCSAVLWKHVQEKCIKCKLHKISLNNDRKNNFIHCLIMVVLYCIEWWRMTAITVLSRILETLSLCVPISTIYFDWIITTNNEITTIHPLFKWSSRWSNLGKVCVGKDIRVQLHTTGTYTCH